MNVHNLNNSFGDCDDEEVTVALWHNDTLADVEHVESDDPKDRYALYAEANNLDTEDWRPDPMPEHAGADWILGVAYLFSDPPGLAGKWKRGEETLRKTEVDYEDLYEPLQPLQLIRVRTHRYVHHAWRSARMTYQDRFVLKEMHPVPEIRDEDEAEEARQMSRSLKCRSNEQMHHPRITNPRRNSGRKPRNKRGLRPQHYASLRAMQFTVANNIARKFEQAEQCLAQRDKNDAREELSLEIEREDRQRMIEHCLAYERVAFFDTAPHGWDELDMYASIPTYHPTSNEGLPISASDLDEDILFGENYAYSERRRRNTLSAILYDLDQEYAVEPLTHASA